MQTYQIAPEKAETIPPLVALLKATGYVAEFDGRELKTDAPYAVLNNQLPPIITEKMVRDLVRAAFKGQNYLAPGLSSVLWPLDGTFTITFRGNEAHLDLTKKWSNSGKRAYAWLAKRIEHTGTPIL
jgi:hypothetical protein